MELGCDHLLHHQRNHAHNRFEHLQHGHYGFGDGDAGSYCGQAGYTNSSVGSAVYHQWPAATPTFTPAAGAYSPAQSVTISDANLGRDHLLHHQRNNANNLARPSTPLPSL